VHKLEHPQKLGGKSYTHVCLICADDISKKNGMSEEWRESLIKTASWSNAKGHITKMHKFHPYALVLASAVSTKATKNVRAFDHAFAATTTAAPAHFLSEADPAKRTSGAVAVAVSPKRLKQSNITESMHVAKEVAVHVATSRWLSRQGHVAVL